MTRTLHRFRIVVALDRSEYSEIVLEHALDQAARHTSPDLHFVTVVAGEREVDDAKAWLASVVREGVDTFRSDRADGRVRLHVACGRAAEEISTLAADLSADLLVVGRFGAHGKHSISDRVLTLATCPTLVVGLTERSADAQPQCAACVAIRESSDGERWFCDHHSSSERSHFTALLPSTPLVHGGPLW